MLRVLHSRRGNYATIVALLMAVLLGFASFSLDWFRLRAADQQIQYAADAAALAAVIELANGGDAADAIAIADAILAENIVGEQRGGIRAEYQFGQYDWGNPDHTTAWNPGNEPPNAIHVLAARDNGSGLGEVPLYLAPSFGGPASAAVVGQSVAAIRYREMCLVVDLTGSFLDEMDDARRAVLDFLGFVNNLGSPGDRICMITFTGGATTYTNLQYVAPNFEAIRDAWELLEICDFGPTHWANGYAASWWATTYADFNANVPWARDHPTMIGCHEGNSDLPGWPLDGETPAWAGGNQPFWWSSGTNQSAGLELARQTLEASANSTAVKVIVLISDGEPTCVGENRGIPCQQERADNGLIQSEWAQDAGMTVFTVSFNDPYNETQSLYMASLASPGSQHFFETPNSEELPEMLKTIARSIPTALVQ